MEIGDASPVTGEVLAKIEQLFGTVPPVAASGDLVALGRLLEIFEAAKGLVANEWPTAAGVFDMLRQETERYLLANVADPKATLEYLRQSVELLRTFSASGNPQAVLTDIAKVFIPSSDLEAAPDPAGEELPVMGTLNIQSAEDKSIYTEFVGESLEHLEKIEGGVLEFEHNARNVELVNDIFRCFHSIKGAAGFLGLTALNRLCHESETMLDRVRKNTLRPDREVVEALLCAIDLCRKMLNILSAALESAVNGELTAVDIRPALTMIGLILERPVVVIDADAEPGRIGGMLVEQGVIDHDQLATAIEQQRRPIGKILVDMGAATERQIEELAGTGGAEKTRPADSIKVDTARLDNLLEMVGELVIAQAQVGGDQTLAGFYAQAGQAGQKLQRNIANVGKITASLQELVMALRLVPLRGMFHKMIRLVRDTCRKTGKEAELVIRGEETEIDKTLIDKLADPLVHLLRNAVDHGVEKPEARTAAGKGAAGKVELNAYHAGGNVVIEIRDDGAGIHCEKVLAKARERGLVGANEELEREEIFDLIFAPGLSTNDVATEISGRGVGMDVVRKNIVSLGGRVDVDSTPGAGTLFTIKLPLTMAIVDGIIVEVGEERYILPTLSIEEAIKPKREDISQVTGGKGMAMRVRERLVPLISLHELFETGRQTEPWDGMVVVVHDNSRCCGLVIDAMLEQQQVVIKNLGSKLRGVGGISGGCILGDGRVGLILDVPGIIDLARRS